jgi:cell division protein FtsQ
MFFKACFGSVWWVIKTPFALFGLIVFLLIGWGIYNDLPLKIQRYMVHLATELAIASDVQLEHVYLEGQKNTATEALLEVMDVKIGMPLFLVPIQRIRRELEELPWVRYAEVERQYPSTLTVRIVERVPVALWQVDNQLRLIDSEASVIKISDLSEFSDYLILVGSDIPSHLPHVLELLESEPDLKPLVSSFVRVSSRRWDILLRNGIRIHLPENDSQKMWHYLAQLHNEKRILVDRDIQSINLKIPDRLFIERKSGKKQSLDQKGKHT